MERSTSPHGDPLAAQLEGRVDGPVVTPEDPAFDDARAIWNARLDPIMEWARAFHEAMARYATGGVYVNLLGEDETDGVRAAYGANLERLVELKREWDPENLFRTNHNIEPPG